MQKASNDIPFSPAKCPFFYGWAILLFSSLGIVMSIPGQTMGVSAFTEHLITSLKLSRTDLTLAYMIGTIGSSFVLTQVGKAFDRWGARVIAFCASVGLGLTLVALSASSRIAACIYAVGLGATSVIVMMTIGFFLLRFFGQGVLTMSSRNMLMKWFDHKRGLVTGISGPLVTLGFSVAPLTLNWLIIHVEWQMAWRLLGLVSLFVFTIVVFVFYRDNPEDCGLLPDGITRDEIMKGEKVYRPAQIKQYTLKEARNTFPFWIVALTLGLAAVLMTAIPFHIVSIFKRAHMTEQQAFSIFPYTSALSVFVNLICGYISDKTKIKYMLLPMIAGLGVMSVALAFLSPGMTVYILIAGNALGGGLFGLMTNVPFPRFFGRVHLGAINGFIMSIMVFSSAIGPWAFSKSLDLTGSYKTAALGCAVIAALLLIGALKADNPQVGEPR